MDCVICALPPVVVQGPLLAPYLIKGYLKSKGFEVEALDLNMDLWKKLGVEVDPIETNMDLWKKIGFDDNTLKIKTFRNRAQFEKFCDDKLSVIIKDWATTLVNKKANWIALSMFSKFCALVVERLIIEIKQINPKQKVVLGGPGTKYAIDSFFGTRY